MPRKMKPLMTSSQALLNSGIILLEFLVVQVVDIALEDYLQEGEAEAEQHPDLNNLDAPRLSQRIRDAEKPA